MSFPVHKLYQRQVIFSAHIGIVLTKGRGNVYDAGTVRHGDIIITGHIMGLLPLAVCFLTRAGEQRLILFILQIRPLISLQHLVSRFSLFRQTAQHRVKQSLGHIIGIAVRSLHLYIGFLRIHTTPHWKAASRAWWSRPGNKPPPPHI